VVVVGAAHNPRCHHWVWQKRYSVRFFPT
jgi:hypothetical protein